MSGQESSRDESHDISQILETLLTGAKPEEVDSPVEALQGGDSGERLGEVRPNVEAERIEASGSAAEELDVSELISWVSGDVTHPNEGEIRLGDVPVVTTEVEVKENQEQIPFEIPSMESGAARGTNAGEGGAADKSIQGLISEGSGKILGDVQAKLDEGGMEFVLAHMSSSN